MNRPDSSNNAIETDSSIATKLISIKDNFFILFQRPQGQPCRSGGAKRYPTILLQMLSPHRPLPLGEREAPPLCALLSLLRRPHSRPHSKLARFSVAPRPNPDNRQTKSPDFSGLSYFTGRCRILSWWDDLYPIASDNGFLKPYVTNVSPVLPPKTPQTLIL